MFDTGDVGVFLGLDVGKTTHHGHGLTPPGKKVFDRPLPNSEPPQCCWSPSATAPASPTAAHLASYADLAPTTKSSGTSIHGEHAPRSGDRQLRRAMFPTAFATLHEPLSRIYYDRCRARGKTHTQALLRLARQRTSVLFAMLRDGTFY